MFFIVRHTRIHAKPIFLRFRSILVGNPTPKIDFGHANGLSLG